MATCNYILKIGIELAATAGVIVPRCGQAYQGPASEWEKSLKWNVAERSWAGWLCAVQLGLVKWIHLIVGGMSAGRIRRAYRRRRSGSATSTCRAQSVKTAAAWWPRR